MLECYTLGYAPPLGYLLVFLIFLVTGLLIHRAFRSRGVLLHEDSHQTFGTLRVYEFPQFRALENGTTLHGIQMKGHLSQKPTTYYSPTSGVGRTILDLQAQHRGRALHIGVIGLGVGTLASYCKNDVCIFYEVDERVICIAQRYFSFLSQCPRAEIRQGDGLALLTHELNQRSAGNLDILVVDAFYDGAIPEHLMSEEALRVYIQHLNSQQGIIAIHTSGLSSNSLRSFLDKTDQLLLSTVITTDETKAFCIHSSQWVFIKLTTTNSSETTFASKS